MPSMVRPDYFSPSDPTGFSAMDGLTQAGQDLAQKSGSDQTTDYEGTEKTSSESVVPRESRNVSERSPKALDLTKEKRLGKELVWLQDPLKLAENTISLLKDDKSAKAIDIVRMASKKASCVVSWNHLIDYEMSKGRAQKAVKIYNEVRKPIID
ncbi:MAG: hypothetical protein Q9208_004037 [Pyrenodesmia sp. 3 TL-2023]